MKINYDVKHVDYRNRLRNLDVVAQSKVKSNKFFPVFLVDGREKVFKPLSKTKPLSTPYFAYSEVVWSTIIHDFFDKSTPIYELAIIDNIEDEFENKYHHGVLVDNLERKGEKLVSLYEYFKINPDVAFPYKDYINFCCKFYDFQWLYQTNLSQINPNLVEKLSYQILLSILKCDQNYHYENPLLKFVNGKVVDVAPMIDHEFSSMFLYIDNELLNAMHFGKAINSLLLPKEDKNDIFAPLKYEAFAINSQNLDAILEHYPTMSREFLNNLEVFLQHIKAHPIIMEDKGYMVPFNSDNYKIGEQLYKKHNKEEAERIRKEEIKKQFMPDIDIVSKSVHRDIYISASTLYEEMTRRLEKRK